jgi:hypothetical protein
MPDGFPPQFNDTLRSGVLALISKINIEGVPVGGILSQVIGLLWPKPGDEAEDTWLSIKNYVEAMIDQKLNKERLESLTKDLQGVQSIAQEYARTSMVSPQKGHFLSDLISGLLAIEPKFWDARNPEQMFPLFSSFGTLWIFALAEQALVYKQVYHEDDPDEAIHRKELNDAITKYTAGAQQMFDVVYAWRFSLLTLTEKHTREGANSSGSTWTLTDIYKGAPFKKEATHWDFGLHYHNPGGQAAMEAEMAIRVTQINSTFVESLQNLLAVAQLWKYVDPTVPRPLKIYKIGNEGPWGGGPEFGSPYMDTPPAPGSRITKIRLRHDRVVECLEVFYDGQSGGVHGNPNGGNLSELELAADEYVTEVSCRAGDFIDRLEFKTDKNRLVSGGGTGGRIAFTARGHESWQDVSLFAVGGSADSRRMTGLSLQWRHMTELPAYVPTYKRENKIMSTVNVYLKAQENDYVTNLVEEFAATAGNHQYFPKHGTPAIRLDLVEVSRTGAQFSQRPLSNNSLVQIQTTEDKAKDYPVLSKYTSSALYYYKEAPGDHRQMWAVVKMIPSEGPVLFGEKIYLRNVEDGTHLYPADQGYLGGRTEPFAWDVIA